MANDVTTDVTPDDVPAKDTGADTGADADAAPPQDGARPGKRQRFESVRNMVLSMAVICAGTFVLVGLNPEDQPEGATPTVSYEVESATAARAAPYDLLVPEGLPEDWRATSVRYEPLGDFGATWRLGFLDPDEEYAALTQADGDAAGFVADVTRDAEDTGGTEQVEGRDWARWEGPKYDALVLQEPGVTTVVMGTAGFERLAQFAGALEVVE
ncbi:DUF4245 domain-containing protein [Streptomyces sp. MP131-18]|uniref:DUF4245 domain-containing protein n=1 Tax=Streptomyces sp. MP131-18 TaxID=1857892 RepID=UPI00209B9CE5|nr:DUF4245 domain-containing protein [Streptomyces sp. MP131-18]